MVECKRARIVSAVVFSTLLAFGTVTGCSGTYRPWDFWNQAPRPTAVSDGLLSPEVRDLIEQLKYVEGSYKREDLKDTVLCTRHLQLVARLYALQPVEIRTPEELIGSVKWLPAREYDSRFPRSGSADLDLNTRQVFVREEGFPFTRSGVTELLGEAAYASSLSAARLFYEYHWNFYEGWKNQKAPDNDPLWYGYFPNWLQLRSVRGFTLVFTDSRQEPDNMLETVFAAQSVISMERRLFGGTANLKLSESGPRGKINKSINIGIRRAEELFIRRPGWEIYFKKFHQQSDLLGFGRFLGSQSSLGFLSQEARDSYGVEVVKSFMSDQQKTRDHKSAEELFNEYLANLR